MFKLAGLVCVLIIKLARGSLMLITFGQLNTLHFKVGWGARGMGPGPASSVLGSAKTPYLCHLGPNLTLGVWSCTVGLQEIIFLS